jgi:hypothetical protein
MDRTTTLPRTSTTKYTDSPTTTNGTKKKNNENQSQKEHLHKSSPARLIDRLIEWEENNQHCTTRIHSATNPRPSSHYISHFLIVTRPIQSLRLEIRRITISIYTLYRWMPHQSRNVMANTTTSPSASFSPGLKTWY